MGIPGRAVKGYQLSACGSGRGHWIYCPGMTVVQGQKLKGGYMFGPSRKAVFHERAGGWVRLEETAGWSSRGKRIELCPRYPGAGVQAGGATWRAWLVKNHVVSHCAKWKQKKKEKQRCYYVSVHKSLNSLLITSLWQGFPISFIFFYVTYSWGFARQKLNTFFGTV